MLGSAENSKEGKLAQKTDIEYRFSLAWFAGEKGKEKKRGGKGAENG